MEDDSVQLAARELYVVCDNSAHPSTVKPVPFTTREITPRHRNTHFCRCVFLHSLFSDFRHRAKIDSRVSSRGKISFRIISELPRCGVSLRAADLLADFRHQPGDRLLSPVSRQRAAGVES